MIIITFPLRLCAFVVKNNQMKQMKVKIHILLLISAFQLFSFAEGMAESRQLDLSPAKWIWHPSQRTLQNSFFLFRKEINIEQDVKSAKGWIFADSRYQLFVNGERIQWGPAPSDPRWQEADPADLTKYLKKGKNIIGCQVLFYGAGDGTSPIGVPGFIFKLNLDGTDIVSDGSWKSYLSRSWAPGQYKRWYLRSLQESFDARLFPYGWDTPGFSENKEWLNAMELPGSPNQSSISAGYPEYLYGINGNDNTELRERSIPLMLENRINVTRLAEFYRISWEQPVENYFDMLVPGAFHADKSEPLPDFNGTSVTVQPEGDKAALLTFEFEEQSVGFPCFTIDAPEGTVIEMLVHEAHKPGNEVFFNSHFNSWTRFICREGENAFKTFDYESLRWIQFHIRNFDRPVTLSNIGMLRRSFNFPASPHIVVSDPDLQRLLEANINTLYNSCQDLIVDGMARERQQYSGDCGHQLHPLYQCFGEIRLPARFITTFGQGITKEGYFLDCWPAYDRLARIFERQMDMTQWGPLLDHGVGFCFDSYNHYLYTGNKNDLNETYPRLKQFFNYLKTLVKEEDGLISVVDLGVPWVWMDHDAFRLDRQREKQLAFNLYTSAMCEQALPELCKIFGDEQFMKEVMEFGETLRKNCIEKYWDKNEKIFVDNLPWLEEEKQKRYSDRTLATALLFHQCPENDEKRSLQMLKETPDALGISYPANAIWKLWALAENNEIPTIIDDLKNKWSNMKSVVENNTVSETWDSRHNTQDQWSHCAVAPIIMFYQGIIGAKPLLPGGKRYRLCPNPSDISFIETEIQTINGAIGFKSEGVLGNRKISVEVPEKMEVEIWIDKKESINLPVIGEDGKGKIKYLIEGGKKMVLTLKYT
jgi:alpha-L-rhamnosidase